MGVGASSLEVSIHPIISIVTIVTIATIATINYPLFVNIRNIRIRINHKLSTIN